MRKTFSPLFSSVVYLVITLGKARSTGQKPQGAMGSHWRLGGRGEECPEEQRQRQRGLSGKSLYCDLGGKEESGASWLGIG